MYVFANKFRKGSKKPVRIFLVIDSVKYFVFGQTILFFKCFTNTFRQFMVQIRFDEFFPDMRSAAFISQNEGQSAFDICNFLSIVITGIRTCTQNAGNTFPLSQQSARRSEDIMIDNDL